MIQADETFDGTWPFAPKFSHASGFAMHYVDEGSGDPVILLHGQPTWGYIYRNFIPALAEKHRVIVPDHMGFGKSETPQDRVYTLQTHVENLTAFIEELDLKNITLVVQDWGGPIGAGFAMRNPDRVKQLVLLNTTIGYGAMGRDDLPNPLKTNWFKWIHAGMKTGGFHEVMRNLGSSLLSVMAIVGFRNFAAVNETWIRAYSAPFSTPAECIGAISFPLDIYQNRIRAFVKEGIPLIDNLKSKPAMMIEGLQDTAIPADLAIADFKGLWPDAPIHLLENAGHYCQEDEPEFIVEKILDFLDRDAA